MLFTGFDGVVAAFERQQLMTDVQSCHDRHALQADDFARRADITHMLIEVSGGICESQLLIGGTGNLVFLIENIHADQRGYSR